VNHMIVYVSVVMLSILLTTLLLKQISKSIVKIFLSGPETEIFSRGNSKIHVMTGKNDWLWLFVDGSKMEVGKVESGSWEQLMITMDKLLEKEHWKLLEDFSQHSLGIAQVHVLAVEIITAQNKTFNNS